MSQNAGKPNIETIVNRMRRKPIKKNIAPINNNPLSHEGVPANHFSNSFAINATAGIFRQMFFSFGLLSFLTRKERPFEPGSRDFREPFFFPERKKHSGKKERDLHFFQLEKGSWQSRVLLPQSFSLEKELPGWTTIAMKKE